MANSIKSKSAILSKLGIKELNPMQQEAELAIHENSETVLLSPTGTGKTLAFLLPIIELLDSKIPAIQALILVPSRELAIQIEQVIQEMGTGFKNNAVYGGRPFSKDKVGLKHLPAILIGTPGRIADHIRRETFSTKSIKTLILDEFDKSLEVGFESDMDEIISALPNVSKRILTSATQHVGIPEFVGITSPTYINFLGDEDSQLEVKIIVSPEKDKLETLVKTLNHLGNQPGIVFCNFKESIERVSDFLFDHNIEHGCFYGGMEQKDRERALIKFRNGTHQIIVATDLAARGIDIPEMKFIIHYHLPIKSHEFTHRNGRTARMNSEGTAYVIHWEGENLPGFIKELNPAAEVTEEAKAPEASKWETLFVSGGKKDKISKGDIVGLFIKQGKLEKDQLGMIELKQDCAFVAVHKSKVSTLLSLIDNSRLKKKKVRVSVV